MITEDQILERLDNYKLGFYCDFIGWDMFILILLIAG
jgi:hypothetical protein